MEGWVDLVDLIASRPGRESNQWRFDHESDAQPLHHQLHQDNGFGFITDDDDGDDEDETISYVRLLLQLQTVTSVLMIRSDEQFSFHIATERGWKVAMSQCS